MKTQDKWNVEQKRGKNKNVLKNEKKKKKNFFTDLDVVTSSIWIHIKR